MLCIFQYGLKNTVSIFRETLRTYSRRYSKKLVERKSDASLRKGRCLKWIRKKRDVNDKYVSDKIVMHVGSETRLGYDHTKADYTVVLAITYPDILLTVIGAELTSHESKTRFENYLKHQTTISTSLPHLLSWSFLFLHYHKGLLRKMKRHG